MCPCGKDRCEAELLSKDLQIMSTHTGRLGLALDISPRVHNHRFSPLKLNGVQRTSMMQNSKFVGPGCGQMCGHPIPHV